MAFVNIRIHSVWGTKRREHVLTKEIRFKLFAHIRENAKSKGIFIDCINGYTDHVHCLLSLNSDMSIAKAIQLIKGESAFWANKIRLINSKFEWADEYYAASVSESNIDKVRRYIYNQEEHHSKVSFEEEYHKITGFRLLVK
jgi:putative transposase